MMQSFTEWRQTNHPARTENIDVIWMIWIELYLNELSAKIDALATPAQPVASEQEPSAIEWPEYPKRCNCGNYEEDFEMGANTCIHCGGLLF